MGAMDYPTVAAAVARTGTEIAKLIREGGLTLKDAEAKMKLADIMSALADARMGMAEVQQTLLDRDARIRELEDKLTVEGKMVFEQPLYYLIEGSSRNGPSARRAKTRTRS